MTDINIGKTEILYNSKYFSVCKKNFEKWKYKSDYFFIERVYEKVVAGFVITRDLEVVLIKNYRIPLEKWVIEIPAGICDKIWESVLDSVQREVLEETWYCSNDIEYFASFPTSQGLVNETIDCFVFRNSWQKSKDLNLDLSEDINVILVKIEDFDNFLTKTMSEWFLIDPKVFVFLNILNNNFS